MPAQPAWFHRLDEILADLRGFDTRYLDRQAGQEAVERCVRSSGQMPVGIERLHSRILDSSRPW